VMHVVNGAQITRRDGVGMAGWRALFCGKEGYITDFAVKKGRDGSYGWTAMITVGFMIDLDQNPINGQVDVGEADVPTLLRRPCYSPDDHSHFINATSLFLPSLYYRYLSPLLVLVLSDH